jgi:hypothetical protein
MIDSIVLESVRKQLLERSKVGINKYDVTLDRTDLTIRLDLGEHARKGSSFIFRALFEIKNTNQNLTS